MAKVMLPDLVRRLVFATVPRENLKTINFPAGAEVQRPGYDGTTSSSKGTPFVPEGLAFWELGCVPSNPKRKAQKDYDDRVKEHQQRQDNIRDVTYIAVTAADWQKEPLGLINEKRMAILPM